MQEKQNTALVWFRNDLRIDDNQSLYDATTKHDKVIGLVLIQDFWLKETAFGFKKMEVFRARFLIETIEDLRQELKTLNIPLIVKVDDGNSLKQLCYQYQITDLYIQEEWTKEEVDQEKNIPDTVSVHKSYSQFLFHPDDLPLAIENLPEIFTVFRKACEKNSRVRPCTPKPRKLADEKDQILSSKPLTLQELGYAPFEIHPNSAFPFQGGSGAASERLNHYFWITKKLSYYKKTRNGLLGTDYSSKFSSWLANGSISPKSIYWSVKDYEQKIDKNQSTYWLIFELIWRDYFKYVSLRHGNSIFVVGGIKKRVYDWRQNHQLFDQWINGTTAEPFVNANMLELKNTGFLSNRGRQNVASYFAKTLQMDWRLGAAYFESMLIDYDVHSNYGNWMYNAGVGNDPRDRVFNVGLQAERYDGKGKYQSTWLQKTLF
ncbi:MAG: DASH family cryptochrome [Bacteroidota bacterium]|nr:DASH family cryptochrome [Bacteroidota bacterium]